jgi:multidrug efflux pump subunit AcrA (membrane-fusion protein)
MSISSLIGSINPFNVMTGNQISPAKAKRTSIRLEKREAQLQFLRQSTRLEESTAPHLVRATMIMLSVAVLGFIAWMCFATVEEVTSAPGEIYPTGFSRVVQHFDGGIVKEILVSDGSSVVAGQPLLVLDGVGAQQDLSRASIELRGLQRTEATSRKMFAIQQTLKDQGVSSEVQYLAARQSLDEVENQLSQQQQVVARLRDKVDRLVVHAPYAGIVKGLKLNTIGEVVSPGDPLLEIVPTQDKLVVEARIAPVDIGRVTPGESVKLKISSFDFGRYGTISGRIDSLSATTFTPPAGGESYYRARILLDKDYVGKNKSHKVRPGMTVIAGIITGKKTVMAYLMKPMQRAFENSLTEP